jgi:hypothetical protein
MLIWAGVDISGWISTWLVEVIDWKSTGISSP